MQFGNEAKGSGNMDEDHDISNGMCVSSSVSSSFMFLSPHHLGFIIFCRHRFSLSL